MSRIAVLRPTQPRGDGLFIGFNVRRRAAFVEPCGFPAKVPLDAFAQEFLMTVELIADVIQRSPVPVIPVSGYGEDLVISFYFQLQFSFKIGFDLAVERFMQPCLAFAVKDNIVRIFICIQPPNLIDFVHKVGQIKVRKVLR